ncbi:Aste57867_14937 [Aphanomyces stellatus]|uniref:[acyl-carrier-protein] S-malonyltransferase n=1 Tax=Aphanomyces stellatus TaxID=120398 RepID=A0A485L2X7_9STRA|nr:hypothetical protein As57867_014881 [Aphanomyces stellatus]VFT91751.1 Aste57867_14937 [Aphanomyces stellatus]
MARPSVSLIFTGQGSQRVGMLKDLLEQWPRHVSPILEEAEAAMKRNLKTLMLDGPQEELTQTAIAQPAILTHSYAVLQILKTEMGLDVSQCEFALGHSLGQFTALVAAESLSFHDAIDLVHFRGNAMMQAMQGSADRGAMAALLPVAPAVAEEICADVQAKSGLVCEVANYNSSKQTVISGNLAAVEAAVQLAKERKVRRAVMLDVSAPFHCALMQPAADMLAQRLADVSFQAPVVPVVCNVSADELPHDAIRQRLKEQVVRPVRWSPSVDYCLAHNATTFLELGYGGVLTGLIKQHAPSATCTSLGTAAEARAFIEAHV